MIIQRLTKDIYNILENMEENKRYELLDYYYLQNTSRYYFPNSLIAFYPCILEYHSRKEITCDLSSNIISKGQLYINYRPLIENISSGNTYVLKRSIKCETSYIDELPTNIFELEALNDKLMNYNCYQNGDIHLDHLHYSQGGELKLLRLKK